MVYRAIGVMSGSSLDGLDIAFVELLEHGGKWAFEIIKGDCYSYSEAWIKKLQSASSLSALDYQLLHAEYGNYIGLEVNRFIKENDLQYKVALIASHGHTSFHIPANKMTAQLGDGAAIAAQTRLPVVADLRTMDVAFGGQGAPIVPIGEKMLLSEYDYFLNLGGIANISFKDNSGSIVAFDICPTNRVLNMLANKAGKEYDDKGSLASSGKISHTLLEKLNALEYYNKPYPKSLANDFGTDIIYSIIHDANITIDDALRTYVEHIAIQVKKSILNFKNNSSVSTQSARLLATGGGAFNTFLMQQLNEKLQPLNIAVTVPEETLVKYKEALVMALIGVLRWRQEYNVLASVTGASRNSIGGALWNGQDA